MINRPGYTSHRAKVYVINKTINGQPYDLSDYVINYSDSGDLDQPADTFQLTILPHAIDQQPSYNSVRIYSMWRRVLSKGDILSIGIEQKDSWLFRIDTIFETKKATEKGIARALLLSGRNFASLLIDDDIVMAPELAYDPRAVELLGENRVQFLGILRGFGNDGFSEFKKQCPLSAIIWIMLNMPAMNIEIPYIDFDEKGNVIAEHLEEKNHFAIGRYFTFDLSCYWNDLLYDDNLSQFSGKVWNYITQCIDPMFYECFVETIIDKKINKLRPCLIVRPKPFDRTSDWNLLNENGDLSTTNDNIFNTILNLINPPLDAFDFEKVHKKVEASEADVWIVSLPDEKKKERVGNWWDNDKPITSKINIEGLKYKDKSIFQTLITKKPYHTLDPGEDYGNSIGQTLTDVVNFYTMTSSKDITSTTALARYGYMYPLLDTLSIRKFGIRKLEGKSKMYKEGTLSIGLDEIPDSYRIIKKNIYNEVAYPVEESIRLREKLFHWYRFNPTFYKGEQLMLGHDYIRKGDKIFAPHHLSKTGRQGIFYYIKGVRRKYEVTEDGNIYEMSLNLDRGENTEEMEQYKYSAGYDLSDKGISEESAGGTVRKNPMIKIDYATGIGTTIGGYSSGGKWNTGELLKEAQDKLKNYYNTYESDYKKHNVNTAYELADIIQAVANGINPYVILGIILTESNFNPNYKSGVKAGLCGITENFSSKYGDRLDPESAIKGICNILKNEYNYGDNPLTALRTYHLGVNYSLDSSEGKEYTKTICNNIKIFDPSFPYNGDESETPVKVEEKKENLNVKKVTGDRGKAVQLSKYKPTDNRHKYVTSFKSDDRQWGYELTMERLLTWAEQVHNITGQNVQVGDMSGYNDGWVALSGHETHNDGASADIVITGLVSTAKHNSQGNTSDKTVTDIVHVLDVLINDIGIRESGQGVLFRHDKIENRDKTNWQKESYQRYYPCDLRERVRSVGGVYGDHFNHFHVFFCERF